MVNKVKESPKEELQKYFNDTQAKKKNATPVNEDKVLPIPEEEKEESEDESGLHVEEVDEDLSKTQLRWHKR